MTNAEKIIATFPKVRPALCAEQSAIYEREMIDNRGGKNLMSNLAQRLERWMHVNVAAQMTGKRLLEIGAGNLNHLPYLDTTNAYHVDVVEPMVALYKDSPYRHRVRRFYGDIQEIQESYDTIYSIAVLEHITNLPTVIARAALMLAQDGRFIHGIPCEGGFLWGLSWRCSTGLSYRLRTGHSYAALMRHEHVNTHDEIVALIRHFFEHVDVSYFPLPNKHTAFYACIHAHTPKRRLAEQFLANH